MTNLLTRPLITIAPGGVMTLPGVLAALARDEIDDFPALRPHQAMFWHMFLVQLAALALHLAGRSDIPEDEAAWLTLLRALTPDYPDDEPWCLTVEDWTKPAFMQPAVPEGVTLANPVPTPDALDLLITSKNHDLKQAVARNGAADDWLFSLVTLQTGEGYGGAGNQGIARMNGGSSSRPLLSLAPRPGERAMTPRPGAWFRRDLSMLLGSKDARDMLDFPASGGLGLTWLAPWPEGDQLRTKDLDIWFIEVCRRVRLQERGGRISGHKGTSRAARIDAKTFKGALGDPWAPVHKSENKSFTLASGDFDYDTLSELLFSGDWDRPLLSYPAPFEAAGEPMVIVAMALSRGNSKTEGYKSRFVPLSGRVANMLGSRRKELHELAKFQSDFVGAVDRAMAYALVLAAAAGERESISRDTYAFTRTARAHLDRHADGIFFQHLWATFEAAGDAREAAKLRFMRAIWNRAGTIFEEALPTMPCPSLYRHRSEARARAAFFGSSALRKEYPPLFAKEESDVA